MWQLHHRSESYRCSRRAINSWRRVSDCVNCFDVRTQKATQCVTKSACKQLVLHFASSMIQQLVVPLPSSCVFAADAAARSNTVPAAAAGSSVSSYEGRTDSRARLLPDQGTASAAME
jgi:hypothetical protein